MRNQRVVPALGGLAVAWGGTLLLVSTVSLLLGPPDTLGTVLLAQLGLWVLFALTLLNVTRWEEQPLASIGLRRFRWASLAWGLGLAAAIAWVVIPLMMVVVRSLGLAGFEAGVARLVALPIWTRVIAVVTAGVVEDTLFLGYSFTRLSALIGRPWLAGVLAGGGFCLLHLPAWGVGPVLVLVATTAVSWAFFAWRRDLLANIVAHTLVDGMALVALPALSAVR